MANIDAPNGFHWYGDLTAGIGINPPIVHLDIDTGVSGTIGRGQPCKLDAGGDVVELNGTFANDSGTNGKGIFIAQKDCVALDTGIPFISAGPKSLFIVQADDNVTWTTEALLKAAMHGAAPWFQIFNPSAISTDGLSRSTAELAGTAPHATAGYLRIVDWVDAPDQEFGIHQQVIVRFNPACFQDSAFVDSVVA